MAEIPSDPLERMEVGWERKGYCCLSIRPTWDASPVWTMVGIRALTYKVVVLVSVPP
jgi:hypothetical protein